MTPINKPEIILISPQGSVLATLANYYSEILVNAGYRIQSIDSKNTGVLRYKLIIRLLKIKNSLINIHSSGYYDDISLIYGIILSKIMGNKCILTYHCGSMRDNIKKMGWLIFFFFKKCERIIVVSNDMKKNIIDWKPELKDKLELIENFIKLPENISPDQKYKKENIVLTVSTIVDKQNLYRKGLNLFARLSLNFPKYTFIIVGKCVDNTVTSYLKQLGGNNLKLVGRITENELINIYKQAYIYCQLSESEGLPMALLEAMSFGCIPVVSDKSSLPEVVGTSGFSIKYNDLNDACRIINEIIKKNFSGEPAKKRIYLHYTIEKRKNTILQTFKNILNRTNEK